MTGKSDLLDRILILLNKITLTKEILTATRIHNAIDNVRSEGLCSEEL